MTKVISLDFELASTLDLTDVGADVWSGGGPIILPGVTKFLIDDVFVKGRHDLLWKLALISAIAAGVGAITDYALALILGIAAQRSRTRRCRRWRMGRTTPSRSRGWRRQNREGR